MPARARSPSARAACSLASRSVPCLADPGGQRHRVGFELHRHAERRLEHPLRLGPLPRVAQSQVDGAGADRRLQLARRALRDHPAVVDDRDPAGELVGLVQVLRGQQHGRAVRDHRPDDLPHLVAAARVQTGRRLVEEQQVGGVEDARRDVDAPPHAAGVLLHLPVGRVGQAERGEQGRRRAPGRPACAARAAGRAAPGSPSPVRSSSTEAYWPVRLTRPRTASASVTTSCPKTRARPAVGAQQRRQHPYRGGLAGAVRPEQAVDGAGGHLQVDAVQRPGLPERLGQALGLDGQAGGASTHDRLPSVQTFRRHRGAPRDRRAAPGPTSGAGRAGHGRPGAAGRRAAASVRRRAGRSPTTSRTVIACSAVKTVRSWSTACRPAGPAAVRHEADRLGLPLVVRVVDRLFQRRREAVVVLGGDHDERVRPAHLRGRRPGWTRSARRGSWRGSRSR